MAASLLAGWDDVSCCPQFYALHLLLPLLASFPHSGRPRPLNRMSRHCPPPQTHTNQNYLCNYWGNSFNKALTSASPWSLAEWLQAVPPTCENAMKISGCMYQGTVCFLSYHCSHICAVEYWLAQFTKRQSNPSCLAVQLCGFLTAAEEQCATRPAHVGPTGHECCSDREHTVPAPDGASAAIGGAPRPCLPAGAPHGGYGYRAKQRALPQPSLEVVQIPQIQIENVFRLRPPSHVL